MTLKSIQDMISTYEAEGRLVRFSPSFDPDESEVRDLLLSEQVARAVEEWSGAKEGAHVAAHLGRFVKGKRIEVPYHLKPLRDDIFGFRIMFPRTMRQSQLRVLGGFAAADTFIALRWQYRSALGGQRYQRLQDEVAEAWRELFQSHGRMSARPLSSCITSNAAEGDVRW